MGISPEKIKEATAEALVRAGSSFTPGLRAAYARALELETNERSLWAMRQFLENADVAERRTLPLCDDTGIPHIFLEVGEFAEFGGPHLGAVSEGIAEGLRRLPGRPMAVLGDDVQRIEQSQGLSLYSEDVVPPAFSVKRISGHKVRITVMLLGGGPEIRAKTYRIFHKHRLETVLDEVAQWGIEAVRELGCTPAVVAVGLGRTHFEAVSLMLEAMALGDLEKQTPQEQQVTERINAEGSGPLGLGGRVSVLATLLNIGPQRASGVRIASVRTCCGIEPRRATVELS
jgi:fumarate hydratase subunit alpha